MCGVYVSGACMWGVCVVCLCVSVSVCMRVGVVISHISIAIIKGLTDHLPDGQSHHLFMDKWYITHNSMESVLASGHDFTGIGKRNNFRSLYNNILGRAETNGTGMARAHRNYTDPSGRTHTISSTSVTFMKKKASTHPLPHVQSFFSSVHAGNHVSSDDGGEPKVDMVEDYKRHHRGVDTADQLIRDVEFPHKCSRFVAPVFHFVVHAMVLNAWSIRTQLGHKRGTFAGALQELAQQIIPDIKKDRVASTKCMEQLLSGSRVRQPTLTYAARNDASRAVHTHAVDKITIAPDTRTHVPLRISDAKSALADVKSKDCTECRVSGRGNSRTAYTCSCCIESAVYLHVNGVHNCFVTYHNRLGVKYLLHGAVNSASDMPSHTLNTRSKRMISGN